MGSTTPTNLLFYGLGSIGRGTLSRALTDARCLVVGAVDQDPELVGRDIGEVGDRESEGVRVYATLAEALKAAPQRPKVVIHATGSHFDRVAPQIRAIVEADLDVTTSCEELLFPWRLDRAAAEALDVLAIQRGVSIYPTGVNPGFSLDRWPLALSRVVTGLQAIRARRVVDSATRRPQLRAKTGAGQTEETFRRDAEVGRLGHVGLLESAYFLAAGLGREVTTLYRRIEPVLAESEHVFGDVTVAPGSVAGAFEEVRGRLSGDVELRLTLQISVAAPDPVDEVEIDGDPPLRAAVAGGVAGEPATMAALIEGALTASQRPAGIARF